MANKEKRIKTTENEAARTAATELSASDASPRALAKRKTEVKMALTDSGSKPASTGEKTKSAEASGGADRITNIQLKEEPAGNGKPATTIGDSMKKNRPLIAALSVLYLLMIFLILFCIVPLKEISYQVPVMYQDTETYTEQEPYVDTVYYTDKEPYATTEPYTITQPYMATEPYVTYEQSPAPPPPAPVPPPQPVVYYRDVTRYMTLTQYKDVIQFRDVQKSRNEIKVRPVQKQRTVTKVRQETRYKMVPLLYSLISYEEES
jgi:hypothetical protein